MVVPHQSNVVLIPKATKSRNASPASIAAASKPQPLDTFAVKALAGTMTDADVIKRLGDVGTEAVGSTVAEFDALTRQQFELYRGIVQHDHSLLGGQEVATA